MRRSLAGIAVALLLCLTRSEAQGWRTSSLAEFDEVWQTIDDTFYDPSFGGLDWRGVRVELRPRAEAATSPDEVRAIIREMLARLKRSHLQLLSPAAADDRSPTGDARPPFEFRVLDDPSPSLIVTAVSAGDRARLRPGDVITRVNGVDVSSWAKRTPAGIDRRERDLEIWKDAEREVHGPDRSWMTLTVSAGRTSREVSEQREREPGEVVSLGNLPPLHVRVAAIERRTPSRRRIGVLAFNIWMTPISAPVDSAVDRFRSADGIVIDLRGNPGGLAGMIRGIGGYFFSQSVLLGSSRTREASLEFRTNPRTVTDDGRRVTPFAGPLAILVDELTGSASECFAAALQDLGRARIFGRQTMGQALPASTKRLANGDVLLYAIGDFLTSSGRRVEADGVTPDETIPLTPESLADGHDPVLEAAIRWMDKQRSGTGH